MYKIKESHRTSEQNRKILEEYIRFTDIYSIKSLNQILNQVKLEIEIAIVKDDDEDKTFQEEIKKAKPFDIIKSYRDFLKKKRGRNQE
jgi:hypothetical protein